MPNYANGPCLFTGLCPVINGCVRTPQRRDVANTGKGAHQGTRLGTKSRDSLVRSVH